MMMLLRAFLTVLLYMTCISKSEAQRRKTCSPGEPCVFLAECPAMSDFIKSGNIELINKVRDNICGFSGFKSKVCCSVGGSGTSGDEDGGKIPPILVIPTRPPVTPIRPPVTPNPIPTIPGSDLLPTKCGTPEKLDRIIGGDLAPRGAYPWMVALGYEKIGESPLVPLKYDCAGSLINDRYVLTAAHCLHRRFIGGRRLKVLNVGDWNLATDIDCEVTNLGQSCSPPHIAAGVEDIIVHPQFASRSRFSDDIGLVRLNIKITFSSYIQPICLPTRDFNPEDESNVNRSLTTAGWGVTEFAASSDQLLKVHLTLRDSKVCSDLYKRTFVSNQICVGGETGFDSCKGDSGSPLVMPGVNGPPFEQVGLVSYGPNPCGKKNSPGVYTSVSRYMDWIVQNLKP